MTTQSRLLPSNPAQFHAITTGIMIYLLAFTAITVMGFPLLWMILCSFKGARGTLPGSAKLPAGNHHISKLYGPVHPDRVRAVLCK